MKRGSISAMRRGSLRRASLLPLGCSKTDEIPWDLFDRCFLPVIFSHAAAIIFSTILSTLRISEISSFSWFLTFAVITIGVTIFYHNLQVRAAGKGILITSCDNQIGYALAKQLDDLGFTVYAGFTDKERGLRLKDETSARLHILELDVTSEANIQAAYTFVTQNLPYGALGLWAVVHNTTWAAFGEFEWLPVHVYKKAVDINLMSVIRITQVFLPSVRKARGRVINVCSINGRIPSALRSALCTVKFAVEAFSECLRLEMRKWGVDVVVVEPGTYTTGTWFDEKKLLEEAREMWKSMSDEAHKIYGENYFEYKVRSLPEYTNNNKETHLGPVVKSLTDAVSRTFPLNRYTPVSRQEKIQTFVAEHFPPTVYRIFYS